MLVWSVLPSVGKGAVVFNNSSLPGGLGIILKVLSVTVVDWTTKNSAASEVLLKVQHVDVFNRGFPRGLYPHSKCAAYLLQVEDQLI